MGFTFQPRATELTPQQQIMQVASSRSVHRAFNWFRVHEHELRARQLELTSIPAPPFGEQKRAEWLLRRFEELQLKEIEVDEAGNAIAIRPGAAASRRAVALTAHLDTVFPPETKIQVSADRQKLYGPGISDNAAGITALLAIAAALEQAQVEHEADIVFIGNVGEEGEGDLRGMRHIFAQERWRERIGYTLVIDGTGTDSIVSEALGSRRYEVSVRGPGGHSWSDFGVPNPIVILSRVIAAFAETPLPPSPKTTFNLGTIAGGTSVNSIPEAVTVRVDLRSTKGEEILKLEQLLREILEKEVNGSGQAQKIRFEMKLIGDRPAAELPADARILEVIRAVDLHFRISSQERRASTDANIPLALGLEAISIGSGGQGGGAHTLHEWYDPAGRDLGLKRILLTALVLSGIQ